MPVKVPPAPSLPGVAHTNGCTTVTTVVLLLAETGSVVVLLTVAVLEMGPELEGVVTVMVIEPTAPCAIVPVREQVIAVVPEQVQPVEPVAETRVVPVGMVSATWTVAADACPRFCTWIVYVKLEERNTGVGDAVMKRARSASAAGSTSTVVTVVLLLGTGSTVCEVTVAEFRIVVSAAVPAVTLSVITIGSAAVVAPFAKAS